MQIPVRADGRLAVAMISETFWEPDGAVRLKQRLAEAADRGADLAMLPRAAAQPVEPGEQGAIRG